MFYVLDQELLFICFVSCDLYELKRIDHDYRGRRDVLIRMRRTFAVFGIFHHEEVSVPYYYISSENRILF